MVMSHCLEPLYSGCETGQKYLRINLLEVSVKQIDSVMWINLPEGKC